jgi:DNA-binding protein Fis
MAAGDPQLVAGGGDGHPYIHWVLQAEGGNKTRAAEVLGIDPSTLYRKLNRYGIEV